MIKKITNLILIVFLTVILNIGYADPATQTDLPQEQTNLSVRIWWDRKPVLKHGEPVHIFSEITGDNLELYEFQYTWQYDWHDEYGWRDIEDANEPTYTFYANADTLTWSYRLVVHYRRIDE